MTYQNPTEAKLVSAPPADNKESNTMSKVLFLCKQNYAYGSEKGTFHGLVNSAHFVSNFLVSRRVTSEVHRVLDADAIDAVIQKVNPMVVVIEALWVTPTKLNELMAMPEHKGRLWLVRVHSKSAFLAQEGIAIEWIKGYNEDVIVCPNTRDMTADLKAMGVEAMYLPNIYNPEHYDPSPYSKSRSDGELNIGCFGALRPLKNHLVQAVGALRFADRVGQSMRFHVNEANGGVENENVLGNLRSVFSGTKHELVTHAWASHRDFITLVQKMDMGLQVSLSESFNLIAADFVNNRVPIVVSDEIDWLPNTVTVPATSDSGKIAQMMAYVWKYYHPTIDRKCYRALDSYNQHARDAWWRIAKRLG